MILAKEQTHLDYKEYVNSGSFYTNNSIVSTVWQLIKPYIDDNTIILDNSCGYGNFFEGKNNYDLRGGDIDSFAVQQASKNYPNVLITQKNALNDIDRKNYAISDNAKLIVIGNPPYNDSTSIIRAKIKQINCEIDKDIKKRDLGMSFLLSYQKLSADVICVLHPLSYLIKKNNFSQLRKFTNEYSLIDGVVISSGAFAQTSKNMQFPILIALYKKNKNPMDYNCISNYDFKIDEILSEKTFRLSDFQFVDNNLVQKYPNHKHKKREDDSLLFYTLRDFNALKRCRTFIEKFQSNAVIVDESQLPYYVYLDVIKSFAQHFPYYFGNCDALINIEIFHKYEKYFWADAINRHEKLKRSCPFAIKNNACPQNKIQEYLKILLKEHYVYQ